MLIMGAGRKVFVCSALKNSSRTCYKCTSSGIWDWVMVMRRHSEVFYNVLFAGLTSYKICAKGDIMSVASLWR